ncbi:MAG: isopentenyl-diphosphate Delta-isomerase [archaeon]|nr:isopentenyl-diphosphate Delta-isomerase [archaeon]
MNEKIILVDENDKEIGEKEKQQTHIDGNLHRCFSIQIFNSNGEQLLQKRANHKYHSGGLWTNACCGHPRPGEDTKIAAKRRLKEELGIDCELHEKTIFAYRAEFSNRLTENEIDHLFTGFTDKNPILNPEEAEEYKWISKEELKEDIESHPENYTIWFQIITQKTL